MAYTNITRALIDGQIVDYDKCSFFKEDLENDPAYADKGYVYLGEGKIVEVVYLGKTYNPESFSDLIHFWKSVPKIETGKEKYEKRKWLYQPRENEVDPEKAFED